MPQAFMQKWFPTGGIPEGCPFIATSFYEDSSGIQVTFKIYAYSATESRQLKIFFKAPIIFYSKIGDSLCVISVGDECSIDRGPYGGKWPFFQIQNSPLIERLLKSEQNKALGSTKFFHFMIAGVESDLNIIVTQTPEAKWITI